MSGYRPGRDQYDVSGTGQLNLHPSLRPGQVCWVRSPRTGRWCEGTINRVFMAEDPTASDSATGGKLAGRYRPVVRMFAVNLTDWDLLVTLPDSSVLPLNHQRQRTASFEELMGEAEAGGPGALPPSSPETGHTEVRQ